MRILLVKPRPTSVQFGLAPFFQTEPLGLMYLSSALRQHGHDVMLADMRFERRTATSILKEFRPQLVAISGLHVLEAPGVVALAREIKQFDANIFVATGGHAISSYPDSLDHSRYVDAICLGEGEALLPALCDAVAKGEPLDALPSILLPDGNGRFTPTAPKRKDWLDLAQLPLPDRAAVARYQKNYCCLNYMPVWTMETGRGCSYRCSFCSVWQFYKRTMREHSLGDVRADFAATGRNVFMVDDLFWSDRDRSRELGKVLLESGVRKNWLLVQTRADLITENAGILEQWRPLARNFDVFLGLESHNTTGLKQLRKDAEINKSIEAVKIARKLGFGVTGNFIIDPDYTEEDFHGLWDFLEEHQLFRVGFTILTPLPGTAYFEQTKKRLEVFDWNQYDLHHLLWQPRLEPAKFWELYCESWRRSVLNLAGRKKWYQWLKEVRIQDIPRMAQILSRTQKLMDPQEYLRESALSPRSSPPVPGPLPSSAVESGPVVPLASPAARPRDRA